MKRSLAVIAVVVLMSACSTPPKTAQELRAGGGWGSLSGSKHQKFELSRSFAAAARDVKRRSKECLRWGYTRTTQNGPYISTGTVIYNVGFKERGSNTAEMTLQQDRMPRASGTPPGGYYVFVADLRSAGGKTILEMYGPSFFTWNPVFDAVKGWAEGRNVECPDTP